MTCSLNNNGSSTIRVYNIIIIIPAKINGLIKTKNKKTNPIDRMERLYYSLSTVPIHFRNNGDLIVFNEFRCSAYGGTYYATIAPEATGRKLAYGRPS